MGTVDCRLTRKLKPATSNDLFVMYNALKQVRSLLSPLFSGHSWRSLRNYVGLGRLKHNSRIEDREALLQFISTRTSHVSQSALYGYLRTRAGTRFPELFENPQMIESINIAKWHVWLACLSDLCIYFGYLLREADYPAEAIHDHMVATLEAILEHTGVPDDAGPDFDYARDKVIQRVATCDWGIDRDDDSIFSESPDALVYWAPIAHELKQRDEEIVINSIRFRWIEVRRDARRQLNAQSLMDSAQAG